MCLQNHHKDSFLSFLHCIKNCIIKCNVQMQCNNGAGAASSEVHWYLNAVMMRFIVLHCTLECAAPHVRLQRWPPDARLPAERLNWSVATLKSAQQWSWGKATFPREGCTRRCTEDALGAVQSEAHRGAIGQLPGPGAPWAAGVAEVVKIFWTKTQQLGLRHLLGDVHDALRWKRRFKYYCADL